MINHGDIVGFSGFTAAGAAKAVPLAVAAQAKREHEAGRAFQIGVLAGASTGPSLDGALAEAEAVSFRAPFQSDPGMRALINQGKVRFVDMHISMLPQMVRYGSLGHLNWAVLEASGVTGGGGIVLTTSVGASPTFAHCADKVIVELNRRYPAAMLGLHDIFEPEDPPTRRELPIYTVRDRVGSPMITVPPSKIAGVVLTDLSDETPLFRKTSRLTDEIGYNVADFLVAELRRGRIPAHFLPLQSGLGNTGNCVLTAMADHRGIPAFEMYTEVLQDSVLPLIESGRCQFASACAIGFSPAVMARLVENLSFFRSRMVLRPQEVTNHPELIRRLGVISVNTAIEVDLFGNVNSTHIMGRQLMNGIGGSGDFTRNAYLSIFTCPATRDGGKISTIVPSVTHSDHSEHSVQVVATEFGVADLRGLTPHERARLLIKNCAHPDYRTQLTDYLNMVKKGHTPHSIAVSFAMHRKFLDSGDMRNLEWREWMPVEAQEPRVPA